MNYYEHHLGDWAAATGHLSWDEDMAYTRLLRAYYHHERAIPEGQQYRLAKASTPAHRKAVDQVLSEFFELREGHYHQRRADAEVARYQDKQRKARESAQARWSQSGRNANASPNASPNAMRTHSEGNALQTPDTRQKKERAEDLAAPPARAHEAATPDPDPPTDPPPDPTAAGHPPTPAGSVCRAMRQAGLAAVNPGDPRLLALLAQGATEAEFVGLAAEAAAKRKGWAWVLVALQERRKDAAAIALASRPPPTVLSDAAERTAAMLASQRLTPQEMVASAEARKRVMAAVSTIGRAAA